MFILRRITSEGFESNQCLGEVYDLISSIGNESKFKETQDLMKFTEIQEIFSFIVFKNGSEILPLYKKSSYYIMTETGKTFANLTFR